MLEKAQNNLPSKPITLVAGVSGGEGQPLPGHGGRSGSSFSTGFSTGPSFLILVGGLVTYLPGQG